MFKTYRHLHDPSSHRWAGGSCTFSIRVYEEDQFMSVGVAVCSPKDNFCRATGRDKADCSDEIILEYNSNLTMLENIFYGLRTVAGVSTNPDPDTGWNNKWQKAFKLLYWYSEFNFMGLNDLGRAGSCMKWVK